MSYWDDAYQNIMGAQSPQQLESMQFEAPGPIDMALGRGMRVSDLDAFRKQRLTELQEKGARPVQQSLADFANQGWSSDPSFSGKEWTEGLLETTGAGKPDMSNPYVAKSINDFAGRAQTINDLGAMGIDAPAARILANPAFTTHGASLGSFIKDKVKPIDLQEMKYAKQLSDEAANREAFGNMDYLTRETTPEGVMQRASELLDVTGASPEFVTKEMQTPVLKQFETVKPEANATEEQLTARALKGDKQAQAVLDAMQRRKLDIARQNRAIVTSMPTGKMNMNINGLSPAENEALSRAIDNGLDPYKINSRTAKIYAQQEMRNPGRAWNALGAQAAFERNSGVMNTKALLNTIDPLLQKLESAGAVLGNSSLPGYNKAVNYLKEATGRPDIVGFNNLRDDVVAEVERGLMGSGVLSDSKYNRAIKNINSAQSLPQLKAAIANTRTVIQARLESLAKGPNAKQEGRQGIDARPIAPAGTRARVGNKILTSDGKGGWK